MNSAAYFERQGPNRFLATPLVEGAWNRAEQHIAPALGLIAHAIEVDASTRRDSDLTLGRLSYDILGTIPIGAVEIEVAVVRPGRTIELVEARMIHAGRPVVLARAWLMQSFDSAPFAGTSFPALAPPEEMQPAMLSNVWAGAYIGSIEARHEEVEHGRARAWLRTPIDLVAGEAVSATARTLGIVDIANGVAPRASPDAVAFPNLDLTVHLFRAPRQGWLGFDTTVSIGEHGIGLTHSILHDIDGAFGSLAQCLTVRPKRE